MDEATLRALADERYVSLATFRKNGRAVPTPVWVARSGERFYVFTEARAGKVKRLRNDARIRIAGCNARGKVHGAWYAGSARRDDSPATAERAYDALRAKYGWQMRLADFFSRLAGRIEGRAILEIEIEGPAAAE